MQDATLRRLQTLSEAAHLLSPALKAAHTEIPWADIAGFRNRLVALFQWAWTYFTFARSARLITYEAKGEA